MNLDFNLIKIFNKTKSHIYSNENQNIIHSNYDKNLSNETKIINDNGILIDDEINKAEEKEISINLLESDIKNLILNNENNYFVGNSQLSNLIEKLVFNPNFKLENCSGQSYYIDIKKQQIDMNSLNQNHQHRGINSFEELFK